MIKFNITKVEKMFNIGRVFGIKLTLPRKKFIISFILAMCLSRSVQFKEIALHLNENAKTDSNLRRIQRFFENYEMSYVQFAILMMSFIPEKKFRLCIDRTNWRFGSTDINIFALTIYYKGTSIPILFQMLDKRGNSNQDERIDLLERFISIFGHKRIKSLTADREFIGEKWFKFLVNKNIDFQIRLPKSHFIEYLNEKRKGEYLLNKYGKSFLKHVTYQNMKLHLAMDFSKNEKGEDDPLLIITNDENCNASKIYKERWSIEVFFQSIKGRGFNLEQTHLDETKKIAMLFMLTSLAFAVCLTTGVYKDEVEKVIPVKNHGYKANSYFRYGLDALREILARPNILIGYLDNLIEFIVDFVASVFENNTEKFVKIKLKKNVV